MQVIQEFTTEGIEHVLAKTGKKAEPVRNLIEKVFDVKFDNNGDITLETRDRLESMSVHESLEKVSEYFDNIKTFDIAIIYRSILEKVKKIEHFLNRTKICDGKLQKMGNKMSNNDKTVKWLKQLIAETKLKIDKGIALCWEVSFIITRAKEFLSDALKLGENEVPLERFCKGIDNLLPPEFIPNSKGLGEFLSNGGIAGLIGGKLEALGSIGSVIGFVLCGIGIVLVSVVVVAFSIATVLLGILGAITGGVACLLGVPILGERRKQKLNDLVKELSEVQTSLESVNSQLEIGLKQVRESNMDKGLGINLLLHAYNGFTRDIANTKKNARFANSSEDEIIEFLKNTDSIMGCVTKDIQDNYSVGQEEAWKILMFMHGCTKLEEEGILDSNS